MGEEMKGTTRYLDATVMEYALLDHARRVPDRNIVDRVGHGPHVPRRRDGGLRGA